jgi:PTS system beta-glucosides-specific IIC component
MVGNAGLYFLPIYIAYGAAKKLNTSLPMALMLSALLVEPTFISVVSAGEPFNVYGLFPMQLNSYSQTVLPSLLMVWVLSYVFKFFDKHMPKSIKIIGVPFCTLLVMVPLELCILAPIGNWIGMGLSAFFSGLYSIAGPLAVALIAAFWPFLVATGMHVAVIQIAILNMTQLGCDPIVLAGSNIANLALMGMTVSYFIRTKGEEKQMAAANCITLIIGGISEPTLFGILLRNKRAMLCQIIGGFVGGLYGGIMGIAAYTLGASNILCLLQYAGGPASNLVNAIIGGVIAFVVACAVGIVLGFGDEGGLKNFKGKPKKNKAA